MDANPFRTGHHGSFAFGTEQLGWDGFLVVELHATEEISTLFRLEVTLAREAQRDPVDLDALVGAPASLAMACEGQTGFFLRHGVVGELYEVDSTPSVALYRAVIVPYLARARYRRHCRTFLDHSLREIITSVLENRAPAGAQVAGSGLELLQGPVSEPEIVEELGPYVPAKPCFSWEIQGADTLVRVEHRKLRQYVVQYNESDLAFVSRLLEEEGIAYAFEHTPTRSILRLTDQPARASAFADRRPYRIEGVRHGMAHDDEQLVRHFRASRSMRSGSVTMRDYDWERAGILLEASADLGAGQAGRTPTDAEHFEFPARDEELHDDPCAYPARVRAQRFAVEASLCTGASNIRALPVGRRITLLDMDGSPRGDYLVVRAESVALEHHFPGTALDDEPFGFDGRDARSSPTYLCRFTALPAAAAFRPAMATARPRIDGIQTAVVTDQEGRDSKAVEIHCDDWARVRVRFPWDQRDDGAPSSRWIRVSQTWAGAGFGGLQIPRVGQEVLVAYLNGDPDEPTIVGRVYNARNPVPTRPADNPELSTLRSQSSPRAEGHNELQFQDLAGREEVYLHAQRNLKEVVRVDHTTQVGQDDATSVGRDQDLAVGASRRVTVGANQDTTIVGSDSTLVKANHAQTVEGAAMLKVGGDRMTHVDSFEVHVVEKNRTVSVTGNHSFYTQGELHSVADAGHAFYSRGAFVSSASTDHWFSTHGAFRSHAREKHEFASPSLKIATDDTELTQEKTCLLRVGTAFIKISKGLIVINNGAGASIVLTGGMVKVNADSEVSLAASSDVVVKSPKISLKSGSAERDDKQFDSPEVKASFIVRVHANDQTEKGWTDTYVLEAADGSFHQTHDGTADPDKDENGYANIEFTDVPVDKKYKLSVQKPAGPVVLLRDYLFEG